MGELIWDDDARRHPFEIMELYMRYLRRYDPDTFDPEQK